MKSQILWEVKQKIAWLGKKKIKKKYRDNCHFLDQVQ